MNLAEAEGEVHFSGRAARQLNDRVKERQDFALLLRRCASSFMFFYQSLLMVTFIL